MHKLLIVFSFIILFSKCKSIQTKKVDEPKTFELGEYSGGTILGGVVYVFEENNKVLLKWNSDITSFDRTGTFAVENDTIRISYEPLLEITSIPSKEERSTVWFKNNLAEPIGSCNLLLFQNGVAIQIEEEKEGLFQFDFQIEEIDSMYLNWQFVEFELYPQEHKYCPKIDKVNSMLLNGFVEMEVLMEEDLIGHPISSNHADLMIVGKNKIYPGLDYDPNAIYVGGGILEKR